jgi:hypothetical protein
MPVTAWDPGLKFNFRSWCLRSWHLLWNARQVSASVSFYEQQHTHMPASFSLHPSQCCPIHGRGSAWWDGSLWRAGGCADDGSMESAFQGKWVCSHRLPSSSIFYKWTASGELNVTSEVMEVLVLIFMRVQCNCFSETRALPRCLFKSYDSGVPVYAN